MKPEDRAKVEQLRQATNGFRLGLKEWETIKKVVSQGSTILVSIDTYDVKVLVREDRYLRHGTRLLVFENGRLDDEITQWDDSFEPYVFEKVGRRDTAEELTARRDWEKMCHRPGNSRTPLDSYERVCDPLIKSTDKMERHF